MLTRSRLFRYAQALEPFVGSLAKQVIFYRQRRKLTFDTRMHIRRKIFRIVECSG